MLYCIGLMYGNLFSYDTIFRLSQYIYIDKYKLLTSLEMKYKMLIFNEANHLEFFSLQ